MGVGVVTGGGRGVGRAKVQRLVDDGYAVVIVERDVETMTPAWDGFRSPCRQGCDRRR